MIETSIVIERTILQFDRVNMLLGVTLAMKITTGLIHLMLPEVPHWKLIPLVPSYVASLISLAYCGHFAVTAAGNKWLFWITRGLGLVSFISDVLFVILVAIPLVAMDLEDIVSVIWMITIYGCISVYEAFSSLDWTLTWWEAQYRPPTYAPVYHGAISGWTDTRREQDSAGEVATLYSQLVQENELARDKQHRRKTKREEGWKSLQVDVPLPALPYRALTRSLSRTPELLQPN